MPRKSTTSSTPVATPVATPAVVSQEAPVVVAPEATKPAPKAPKEPKAPKAPKESKEAKAPKEPKAPRKETKEAKAPEQAVVTETEVVEVSAAVVEDAKEDKPAGYRGHAFTAGDLQMDSKFDELTKQLATVVSMIGALEASCRVLQKEVRECRRTTYRRRNELLLNQCKPRKNKSGNNSFVTVSDKLCSLLGYSVGDVVSRSQVRSDLTKYIKTNKLEKTDGRFWNYNPALEDVFGKVDNFGYFAIAKALSPHLTKAAAPAPQTQQPVASA